jgi:hypothetical protein
VWQEELEISAATFDKWVKSCEWLPNEKSPGKVRGIRTKTLPDGPGQPHAFGAAKDLETIKRNRDACAIHSAPPGYVHMNQVVKVSKKTAKTLRKHLKVKSGVVKRDRSKGQDGRAINGAFVPTWFMDDAIAQRRKQLQAELAELDRVHQPADAASDEGAKSKNRKRDHDPQTMKVYQYCYVQYRLRGRTRAEVVEDCLRLFTYPKEEAHVTIFADRFAKYNGLPRHPSQAEAAELLRTLPSEESDP